MNMLDVFKNDASNLLGQLGQEVVWTPEGGEGVTTLAIVRDHGEGFPPNQFQRDLFHGRARYAEFRIHADAGNPAYGDTVTWNGHEFEVRQVVPVAGFNLLRCADWPEIPNMQTITIQTSVEAANEYHEVEPTWQDFATVSATIEPMHGREIVSAGSVRSEVTHRICSRWVPGVTAKMRVLFDGRFFDISSVINVEERGRAMEIMAVERD